MSIITVDATFEGGVLRPKNPIALPEGAEVRLEIRPAADPADDPDDGPIDDPLADVIGIGDSGRTDGAENHDKYLYGKLAR